MACPLAPDTPPDAALRQIVADCHADLLKHRTIALTTRRPIGIHQTRVALRKLRAAFSLFAGAVAGPIERRQVRALAQEAKWLATECAPARDLHVFLTETVPDLPPEVKRIANRLAKAHLERARAALTSARFSAFDAELLQFKGTIPETPPVGRLEDFGREVLERRHAKVEQRGRKLADLDGKRLHRLRIAIKKLRYAATFLQPAFPPPDFDSRSTSAYIQATVRLQGALGALNDREVADQMVADIAAAARPNEKVGGKLRKLANKASGGGKRRRRKLAEAWKKFEKAGCFWRPQTR
jgi:CHAD domain-containing protein